MQIDQKSSNGNSPSGTSVSTQDQQDAKQASDNAVAGITCYTTDCDASCKKGTNQVAQMNGQPGDLSTNDRCSKGKYRNLCCDDGTIMGICQWRGYRKSTFAQTYVFLPSFKMFVTRNAPYTDSKTNRWCWSIVYERM